MIEERGAFQASGFNIERRLRRWAAEELPFPARPGQTGRCGRSSEGCKACPRRDHPLGRWWALHCHQSWLWEGEGEGLQQIRRRRQ